MKREATHIKPETNIRSLAEDYEKLREKLYQQKGEFEKLLTDYELLTEKCNSQLEENLSLKFQLSSSFGSFSRKEATAGDINMTCKKSGTKKAHIIITGNFQHDHGIRPEKLKTLHTLDESTPTIEIN